MTTVYTVIIHDCDEDKARQFINTFRSLETYFEDFEPGQIIQVETDWKAEELAERLGCEPKNLILSARNKKDKRRLQISTLNKKDSDYIAPKRKEEVSEQIQARRTRSQTLTALEALKAKSELFNTSLTETRITRPELPHTPVQTRRLRQEFAHIQRRDKRRKEDQKSRTQYPFLIPEHSGN